MNDNSPATGAPFTLSATVRNAGDGESAATTLRFYRSTDGTITTSDTVAGTDAVAGLAESGSYLGSVDLTAPSTAGTYYYGACVDAVTDESDTTNNCSASVTVTVPEPPTSPVETQGCPADAETWRGLKVCDERPRDGYARDAFGTGYSSLEDEIIAALPPTMKANGQVYTPYSCLAFDITANGTAATDIEHIVALAETHDSGIADERRRDIASDLDNLTIADPTVNRSQKSDRDAAEWMPARHGAWFAERVIQVKLEYGLSVDPAERDALDALLAGGEAQLNCVGTPPATTSPDLEVDSPTVNDNSPATSATFTLSATVRNAGDGESAATTLRFYRSTDETITTSVTSVGTDAVGGLAAGAVSVESINLTAPSTAGTYYYGACVGAVADESDTTNNCSASVQVTVPAPTPQAPRTSFGGGTWLVNTDIAPGRYFTNPSSGCYWERLSGTGGTTAERLANEFIGFNSAQEIVDIRSSDYAFTSSDCGTWSRSPVPAPAAGSIPPGRWLVGRQVPAGEYEINAQSGCYWERLSGFSGNSRDRIVNDFVGDAGRQIVSLSSSDAGFYSSSDCGTWSRRGP